MSKTDYPHLRALGRIVKAIDEVELKDALSKEIEPRSEEELVEDSEAVIRAFTRAGLYRPAE